MSANHLFLKRAVMTLAVVLLISVCHPNSHAFKVNKSVGGKDVKWDKKSATYLINVFGGPADALSAVRAAMDTWSNVVSSSFQFLYAGNAFLPCADNDKMNGVCFESLNSTGTLAVNMIWYERSTGKIVETDIRFNTDYVYSTDGSSTSYDVQNIGTHEFGHSLSLADLTSTSDSDKTMYGYGAKGETKKRVLTQDDKDGISYLYPSGICEYNLSEANKVFWSAGGTGTINMTATFSCKWSAISSSDWIKVTSGSTGTEWNGLLHSS